MSSRSTNVQWLLLVQSGCLQFTLFTLRLALVYKTLELGINASLLGLVAASYALAPMLIAIWVGRATDRGFIRSALLLGAAGMLLASIGFLFWSHSFTLILVWGLLLGLGHIMGVAAQQTLIARSSDEQLDTAFGLYTFFGTLGQTLGPILIVVLGGSGHYMNSTAVGIGLVLSAILLIAVTILLVARSQTMLPTRPSVYPEPTPSLLQVIRAPGVNRGKLYGTVAISLALLAMIDVVALYLPAWGVENEISATTIGLLLTVRSLAMMVSRLFLGALARRYGRPRLLLWSTLISAAAVMILVAPIPIWLAMLSMLLSGLFVGLGQPLTMAIVAQEAPPSTRGTWLSVRLAGNSAGQLALPALIGANAAFIGAGGVLFLSGAGLALIGLSSHILFRDPGSRPPPSESSEK